MICQYSVIFGITCVYSYRYFEHSGDLIVAHNEVLIIDSTEYLQNGNVLVIGNGNLTITNSRFSMIAENRTYITLSDNGVLKVVNSELTSQVHVLHFRCYNDTRVSFVNTSFSFFGSTVVEMWGDSAAFFEKSSDTSIETHDRATVIVEDSTIYRISCSASSTGFLQNSNVTAGSDCIGYSTLTLKHSSLQKWLKIENSARLIATEESTLEVLWTNHSSNVTINDSYANHISPSGSSAILLTNGSSVDYLTINVQSGSSQILGLREGHIENYTVFQEREGLNINILKSSVDSFTVDVGSNSHLFLEDSRIRKLSISSFGSATIYNSEVRIVFCDENSLVTMWNSKTHFPIQASPNATVRYFSTISPTLFFTVLVVAATLAIALTVAIVKTRRHRGTDFAPTDYVVKGLDCLVNSVS